MRSYAVKRLSLDVPYPQFSAVVQIDGLASAPMKPLESGRVVVGCAVASEMVHQLPRYGSRPYQGTAASC